MQIRPARAGEAAQLSRIAFASKSHWPYTPAQLALWRDDLTITEAMLAHGTVSVAELEGQGAGSIAGFFMLLPAPQHWVLEHFWVAPARMGQGVGRALLAHAVALARDGGAQALRIDADPHAEAFYLAQGARRVGEVAAPIAGQAWRVRPQLLFYCAQAAASA
jgi:GNAT superfamily N-acetyltransferase